MKTKVSKRILSVLLAALMVITSVPLTVFAFNVSADIDAAKDPAVIEVTDAMTAYENKMDGKVYTNMSAAYNAYVDAQKAIDSYIYGGVSNALEGKAAALTTAIANMSEFTAYKGNGVAEIGSSIVPSDAYTNLLYADGSAATDYSVGVEAGKFSGALKYGCFGYIYYPETVLLYDGTTPSMPVISGYANTNKRYKTQPRAMYTTTENLELRDNWNGYTDGFVWSTATNYQIGYSASTWTGSMACDNNSTKRSYSNTMYYTATPTTALTTIDSTNWTFAQDHNSATADMTLGTKIQIINYKILVDAIANNTDRLNLHVSDYTQGGMAALCATFDRATSLDPNSYFTSGNRATECANEIQAAANGLAVTPTKDAQSYQNLRRAMDVKMAAYNNGVNNGLTDASYAELKTAYENAMDIMRNGYSNPTGAQDAADILNNLILETDVETVNADALIALINVFETYSHIFTADSYSAAENAVYTAKETVWGAENKYGDPSSLLALSDENQAKVDAQVEAVGNAVKALRVDPDAVVATEYGRMSLNDAIELVDALNPDDWSNIGEIQTVVNKAKEYIAKAGMTDLTDYTAQYDEYVAEIEKVMVAYNGRKATFMSIPNGLAFKNTGINYLTDMTRNDQGIVGVGFSYTDKAVVFRKTHDALNTTYGTATIKMISGVKNGSSTPLANNMLDSININASDDASTGYINGYSGTSSKPPALNDSHKAANPGCLTYAANGNSTFALERLTYAGRSDNNNCPRIITLQDGTEITDEATAYATDLTEILGTTDGVSSDPGRGGVFARTSDNNVAETYVNADMTLSLPATDAPALNASTAPITVTNYVMRTNFSAVVLRNVQNMTAVSGYERFTSVTNNNEKIYTQVEVIDISYLVDLINMCNTVVKNDSAKYTDTSLKVFTDALSKAQEELDYNNQAITSTTIVDRCKTRYTNLWDAYQALELKKLAVTFNYKNADGTDASTVISVTPGHTLAEYADEINAIATPQWTSADGALKYTFKEWSPAFDVNAAIIIDTTFTAVYDSESNLADFISYNNARATLMGKLIDETYTTSDLEAVNAAISEMKYFNYTDEEKAVTMGTEQAAINAETAKLVELAENLTPSTVDVTSAKALVEKAKAEAGIDEDVYNIGALDFSYTSEVTVGDETVIGLTFGSQDDVDAAIRAALNSSNLNKCIYTIYLNDVAVGTAEYGSPVIVDSNGNFAKDVTDMDANISEGAKMVAWSYSYAAPSRNNVKSEAKYMLTATSLGFIVKGDTYLTTANAAENEEGYVVKFATNDGKVFDVQYTTNGTVTVPAAPNYAFYTFTGYEGGYQKDDIIPVSSNMTITANYVADTKGTLSIWYFDSILSWNQLTPSNENNIYNYNETVEFSTPNAYCWTSAVYNEDDNTTDLVLLAYGDSYSFCAAKSYDNDMLEGIVAVSESDYQSILSGKMSDYALYDGAGNKIEASRDPQWGGYIYPDPVATVSVLDEVIPVYDSSNKLAKFSMIGTFTLPEGYEIVEAGILFTSQQGSDLKVENVGKNGIARFKASRHTAGNQFVQNVWAPSDGRVVSFDYAAYAIVKDADGNLKTLYSKTVAGTTQGL